MFALNLMCFGQPRAPHKSQAPRPENLPQNRNYYSYFDTKYRELLYLAFRFVFRAGAAIRNVARSVQATSAESELQ